MGAGRVCLSRVLRSVGRTPRGERRGEAVLREVEELVARTSPRPTNPANHPAGVLEAWRAAKTSVRRCELAVEPSIHDRPHKPTTSPTHAASNTYNSFVCLPFPLAAPSAGQAAHAAWKEGSLGEAEAQDLGQVVRHVQGVVRDVHADEGVQEVPSPMLHVSVSRPFEIRHFRVDAFLGRLCFALRNTEAFEIGVGDAAYFGSFVERKTFVGLRVVHGTSPLWALIRTINSVMAEFGLPCYTDDQRPHLSVSVLTNPSPANHPLPTPRDTHAPVIPPSLRCPPLPVRVVECRIGKRVHRFPLHTDQPPSNDLQTLMHLLNQ